MSLLVDFIVLALGLAFGSFANVLIFRLGITGNDLRAPSACTSCDQQIKRRDNIPVISWVLLRGKCRSCKNRISALYPAVEMATAVLFLLFANLPGCSLVATASAGDLGQLLKVLPITVALWWLVCAGVALAFIDFKTLRLPNSLVLSIAISGVVGLGLASLLSTDFDAILRALIGCLLSGVIYGLIILVSPNGIGLGDLKLAAALGFYLGWFGWGALFVGLLLAFILGSVFGLALIAGRRAQKRTAIAFGPWMILGAFLSLGFGEQIWSNYLLFLQWALV